MSGSKAGQKKIWAIVKLRGADSAEEFTASNIKGARIVFTPGASLHGTQGNVRFEAEKPYETTIQEDGNAETKKTEAGNKGGWWLWAGIAGMVVDVAVAMRCYCPP